MYDGSVAQAPDTTRTYRMRKRLEDVEDTRRRIVEAAVELHGTVGPAHTTISSVAERAGVQRSTVYRHFPDEEALFGACTSHWLARHPWPSPDAWAEEGDPVARLGRGLTELYGYYEANSEMLANSYRDLAVVPPFVAELMRATVDRLHEVLVAPWPEQADRRIVSAAIAHALDFRSWQSLAGTGLDSDAAAALMTRMVSAAAAP